jgi:hypothetical protein
MKKPILKPDDYLTLAEAEARGLGKADTLKHRCLRGTLAGRKSGGTWLVRLSDLKAARKRLR